MNMQRLRFYLSIAILISATVVCHATVKIRVTGNNVNLRSAPTNASEVVGQVSIDEILQTTGSVGGWLQVVPPAKVDFWVYDEFIVKDKVVVSRLQVRGGPGINYKSLGVLDKGDEVVSRGVKGDWRKIAPPAGCFLWISNDYADVVKPHNVRIVKKVPVAPPVSRKPPKPTVRRRVNVRIPASVKVKSPAQAKPTSPSRARNVKGLIDESKLQKNVDQGSVVKRTGVVKLSGMVWRRPSDFRLVIYDKWDRAVTICYIVSEKRGLDSMEGKDVYIVGNEYWIQGVRYPVVVIESIILNN